MSDKIKVGVIGVGVLGKHHTRLYKQDKHAELVGIYDANKETAKAVSEEFGVKAFPTIKELSANCDGLSISVPADLHYEIALELLKDKKHLLIEKPITAKVEHAEELVQLAENNNVVLSVGHVERFNPVMSFLEKQAGKTRFIEAHRLAPYPPPRPGMHRRGTEVGVVLDLMIHDLDIILHMVDSEVERVDAVGIPVLSKGEDIANARIKFKNGCVANVTASRVSPEPMRKFRVFLTDSYISLDYADRSGVMYTRGLLGIKKIAVPVNDHNALEKELEDFVNCVQAAIKTGKAPSPKVSGRHGLEALKLAVLITDTLHAYNKHYKVFEK
ncbi:MAG TPA: oxidoreductase [Lentisphaeria bacterium]|nr:MAG: hypothetical protein A2X48_15535 [Lentisphaerae bacterium GWF2_49_21]HBC85336.1 oxidoreductase [Lentisphaeria bacterium]